MSGRLTIRQSQNRGGRSFVATRCRGLRFTAKYRASQNGPTEVMNDRSCGARCLKSLRTTRLEGEEIMIEIRKTITLRETVFRNLASKQHGQLLGPWEWQ